ncbi:MAG: hypothetical protein HC860_05890 [Alkalinema sp. RU_4_3]|nr:hypothetical protein [Alkalinema sp. RU_4_3]
MRPPILLLGLSLIGLLTACPKPDEVKQQETASVITLTQVGCQFLETETQNQQFKPQRAEDCRGLNAKADRRPGFKPLKLKAGDYIFRVTNQNVPYELGFYLRGEGVSQVTLPKVSGGGLTQGLTKDYQISLKPGKYVFSCPLNPTPDYPLIVE